ncbi:TonB-dependent receptor [candidate division KSB1 bacterium]|nr:TonB-dependent receptor [candidate division KSB1 bacterium]
MQAKLWTLPLLLLLVWSISAPLPAGTTGKIIGRITDRETGEPLPGVNVLVEGTQLGAATDIDGNYFILRLAPGVYAIRATMIGYDNLRYEQVRVSVDKTTELNFSLSSAVLELGTTVTVIAEKPIVERDLTSTSVTVDAQVIQRLPVTSIQDVINLQAGVVDGHFRGGRSGEVAYLIDGVSINDVYNNDFSLQVENQSVQELQIISGTFNAEYGQAMSGIVNVVTKEGGSTYHGQIQSYVGDYLSNHTDVFWNIDALNPIYNFEGTLSGPLPLLGKSVTFFAAGRYADYEGALYGRNSFTPTDSSNFPSTDIRDWMIESRGIEHRFSSPEDFARLSDSLRNASDYVPMNPSQRWTGQIKLTTRVSASDKIDYEGLIQHHKYKTYNHRFRLNPDGDFWRYQTGWNNTLTWTHVFNHRTFMTTKAARFYTDYRQQVYSDPYDPRYTNPMLLMAASGSAFLTGGQEMWHFKRNTTTSIGKIDLTSQITQTHQIKTGIELRRHRLWLRAFEIRLNRETGWQPYVPTRTQNVQNNDEYLYYPIEASAYLQDKIELHYMVVNAGVRLDYFSSQGIVPINFSDPAYSPTRKASSEYQISPRVGLSYPITDRGAIHVSYGHFFQIPGFEHLFSNPEFELYATSNYGSTNPPERQPNTIGNAELKPQKTTIYEIGLQQQIGFDLSLDVTAFFKDIRNLLGTEILHTTTGIRYARYINRDYGNVKGLTVALEKRFGGGIGATIDYTYQIAQGNASDPTSAFLDVQAGREPQKQLVPLNWDRTHSLNTSLTLGDPDRMSASIIGRLGSGFPYTPTEQNVRTAVENSERKPAVYTVDLYAYRRFGIANMNATVFVRVFNLFDRMNETDVYSDTGRANYSIAAERSGTIFGVNTLDEWIRRPDFYSEPRQVMLGFSLDF